MAIQVGDEISKVDVINNYITEIRNKINAYLVVKNSTASSYGGTYSNLGSVKSIFADVNTSEPTVSDITETLITSINSSDNISTGIIGLFNTFMTKYTRGRTMTYTEEVGNWTNGGTITYTTNTIGTYKALMSDIQASSTPLTGNWATNSTQPPYNTVNLDTLAKAKAAKVYHSEIITVSNYQTFFTSMYNAWKSVVDNNAIRINYRYCHSDCHSSCHGSRSRR